MIQHGSFGSPESNWFPWLKAKVTAKRHKCLTPRLITNKNKQNLSAWLSEFQHQVPQLNKRTILVGHSIACAFFISMLEQRKTPVKASFLVSGFLKNPGGDPVYEKVNRTFLNLRHNWKLIRNLCGKIYQYGANDDPYVPYAKQKELADNLHVKIKVINQGGHLNSESGFTKFPQLWEDLNKLL